MERREPGAVAWVLLEVLFVRPVLLLVTLAVLSLDRARLGREPLNASTVRLHG